MNLWDYNNHGRNEILSWAKHLSKRDRAALNQKLDVLTRLDYEVAHCLKLLSGPVWKTGHVLKLRAFGDTALRPLLCRGPQAPNAEYTLLHGAQERDGAMVPSHAVEKAKQNRSRVEKQPAAWRAAHVRA